MNEWLEMSTAPKEPRKDWYGPRVLVCQTIAGFPHIYIARYHYGVHKCFVDERETSSLNSNAKCESIRWMPLPEPWEPPK